MIELQKHDGTVENMTVEEFSRWMCLVEAFHFLEIKAEELKVDLSALIKPLAIKNYIKDRYDSMKHDVECELKLGNL